MVVQYAATGLRLATHQNAHPPERRLSVTTVDVDIIADIIAAAAAVTNKVRACQTRKRPPPRHSLPNKEGGTLGGVPPPPHAAKQPRARACFSCQVLVAQSADSGGGPGLGRRLRHVRMG